MDGLDLVTDLGWERRKADIPHGRCLGCVGRLSGNLGRRHYCATELKRAIGGKIAVRAPVVYE